MYVYMYSIVGIEYKNDNPKTRGSPLADKKWVPGIIETKKNAKTKNDAATAVSRRAVRSVVNS